MVGRVHPEVPAPSREGLIEDARQFFDTVSVSHRPIRCQHEMRALEHSQACPMGDRLELLDIHCGLAGPKEARHQESDRNDEKASHGP
jgi:hypothetical protein